MKKLIRVIVYLLILITFIACQRGNINSKLGIEVKNQEQDLKVETDIEPDNNVYGGIKLDYQENVIRGYLSNRKFYLPEDFLTSRIDLDMVGFINSRAAKGVYYEIDNGKIFEADKTGQKKLMFDSEHEINVDFAYLTDVEFSVSINNNLFVGVTMIKNFSEFMFLFNVEKNELDYDYIEVFYGKQFIEDMKNKEYDYYGSEEGRYEYIPYPMYFDNRIIVKQIDLRQPHAVIYYTYDVLTHEKKELIKEYSENETYYKMENTLYYDDKYLYLSFYAVNETTVQYNLHTGDKMFIVDRNTFEKRGEIELSAISEFMPNLIKIEDKKMFFYDPKESALKAIDFSKGIGADAKIYNIIAFEKESRCVGYDDIENRVIVRLNYISNDFESSNTIYAYYDFDTGDVEVIQEVMLDEIVSSVSGLDEIYEYLVGDLIYVDYVLPDSAYDFAGGATRYKINIR